MHLETSTHEQSHTARVYSYEADFDVGAERITWRAQVCHADEPTREIAGEIPITTPALPAFAEKAVRDAIMQRIDGLTATGSAAQSAQAPDRARRKTAGKPAASGVDDDPPLQGEGNYAAARRYDQAQQRFVKSGQVAKAARAAKPKGPREADALARAEQVGRGKAKR